MAHPDDPRAPDRVDRRLLAVIILGAILVRSGVMVGGLGRLDDPDRYLTLARSMADGHGFSLQGRPTAYRPPLYPILLAPLVTSFDRHALPWAVGGLHLVLGVASVLLIHGTARRWGMTPGRCLIAATIVAFDPVLVSQARSVMTETPAAFLVAATLALVSLGGRKGAILGGLAFGLSSLCRPSLLPAAMLATMASLVVGPGGWRARAARSGLLGLATLATLAPWACRNASALGEPIWTTTHGGYTLALANNPAYYADVLDGPPGAVWSGPNQSRWFDEVGRSTKGMSEPEADRLLRSNALRMLTERPGDFFRASLARLGRFWGLAPSEAVYNNRLRMLTMIWTVPLWSALLLGLSRRENWRWPEVVAPAFIISLTIVHLFYWTDLRMRAPLVPAIALIAAGARSPTRFRRGPATGNPVMSEIKGPQNIKNS